MAKKASIVEEESLDIIYQEVLDVLEKHRVNQQVATTICLTVLNVAVGSLYQLNDEQREEIADLLADNVEKTIYSYLEKIHGT